MKQEKEKLNEWILTFVDTQHDMQSSAPTNKITEI